MKLDFLPLSNGKIGIEREMLRTTHDGRLAMTMHPERLGHVLTHPNITIDYAESLIEVVTDPIAGPQNVYQQLFELHQYCAQNIGEERLWPTSMPCILPEHVDDIEIGYFGTTNSAKIKRLYRRGLGLRYGRPMQMIAGVHFNYSPPSEIWKQLAIQDHTDLNQDYINDRYMSMLRGIQRYGWLICYLFGASPAVDESFTPGQNVLDHFAQNTLGWEFAKTLRMSKLGYQNKSEFTVSFNHLSEYIHDLVTAVKTHSPNFEYLKLKDQSGFYQQISTNILQIENEYYTAARPKQITQGNELPTKALHERGIAYIELRLLDINPLDPCGISQSQIYFLEAFMLWTLLKNTEYFSNADYNELTHNRLGVACCGRKQNYQIIHHGIKKQASQWALDLLNEIKVVAQQLDIQNNSSHYVPAVMQLIEEINGQYLKISEQTYKGIKENGFIHWGLKKQKEHLSVLLQPLKENRKIYWDKLAQASLEKFNELEAQPQVPFDDYLAHYFDSLQDIN